MHSTLCQCRGRLNQCPHMDCVTANSSNVLACSMRHRSIISMRGAASHHAQESELAPPAVLTAGICLSRLRCRFSSCPSYSQLLDLLLPQWPSGSWPPETCHSYPPTPGLLHQEIQMNGWLQSVLPTYRPRLVPCALAVEGNVDSAAQPAGAPSRICSGGSDKSGA